MKAAISYRKLLREDLKDPAQAAGYLSAMIETGHRRAFLSALKDVAMVQGGISGLARKTGLHRQSLHRMFSGMGNPEIDSLEKVLEAMGLQLLVGIHKRPKLSRAA